MGIDSRLCTDYREGIGLNKKDSKGFVRFVRIVFTFVLVTVAGCSSECLPEMPYELLDIGLQLSVPKCCLLPTLPFMSWLLRWYS